MSDEFEVGEFDPETVNEPGLDHLTVHGNDHELKFEVKKFVVCSSSMSEYIPCLDNLEGIGKMESMERGERFERHCPVEEKRVSCLVPPPQGYRSPIPWPRSRDEVHFSLCG